MQRKATYRILLPFLSRTPAPAPTYSHHRFSSLIHSSRPILLFHFSDHHTPSRDRQKGPPQAPASFASVDCSRRFLLLGFLSSNGYSHNQRQRHRHHLSFHRNFFTRAKQVQRIEFNDQHSQRAVTTALWCNFLVFSLKFGVWLATSSHVMLAEVIHSVADFANQPPGNIKYAALVIAGSFIIEGASLIVAIQAVKKGAAAEGMKVRDYVWRGHDPTSVAVMTEDGAAVAGLVIAGASLVAVNITGNGIYDPIGSIIVGNLLGMVAIFLIQRNRHALIGRAMDDHDTEKVLHFLKNDPVVDSIYDCKSEVIGPGFFRFKAEIDFNGVFREAAMEKDDDQLLKIMSSYGEEVVTALGSEVDRLEKEIQYLVPGIRHRRMGGLQVFNLRENVLGKKGVGVVCPYCGGPVLAWNFDTHLLLCCIPIHHKLKTKFYCTICSTRLKMGVLKVFNLRENVLGKKGVGVACPYCGGPVLAWNFDTHLLLCCIPIYHKLKTKFYCTICSTRLVFSSSNL
ncbi:hypothetical protein G4B88_009933 [Cannabis sativa]|uniref:Uncharacterized protein n=1 Tax=Cannabis sativa TaxID=3483 RepID=A0A7J6DNA7_CANSA|nr:hypothetical protein G4B88_009933 [Cannabis sativa]